MSLKTKWRSLSSWKKGVVIGAAILLIIFTGTICYSLFTYTGRCAQFLFLGPTQDCSIFEHTQNVFIGLLLLYSSRIVAAVSLGIVIGLTIDKLYNTYN